MKNLILLLVLFVFSNALEAANIARLNQDAKLPTQQMVEKQSFANVIAAGTANVLSANAGNTGAGAVTVTSFVAQPDVARNLVVTPGGTTNDVAACSVTVLGTNNIGQSISEAFAFSANASTATTGSKAFLTVTGVVFPAGCEDSPYGATWSIGYGEKLGVKRCMDSAGHILFSTLNGSKEGTAPTMAVDSDELEKNTADFNGTMNGSNDFELFFFQNFNSNCFP